MITADGHRRFARLIEEDRSVVLVTHMNPDGDALGSQIGLGRFLRSRGIDVSILNSDPVPPTLDLLDPGDLDVEIYRSEAHDGLIDAVDRLVLLDNSAPDRLGRMEERIVREAGRTLCIDHHPTRKTPWAENILDEDACATAAMVYDLTTRAGWTPDASAARAMYVGLATDTGFFRFNSTNEQAHRIAADLLALGVDPAMCYREIQERQSVAFTRLLGMALSGLEVHGDGRVASVGITRGMIEACDGDGVDTSEMTTPLLALDGVRVALLFRELPDGRIKVSLRSKGEIDVHRLALGFGGGGHRNASGIVADGELRAVSDAVVSRALDLVGAVR